MTTHNMSRQVEIKLTCYWDGTTAVDETAYFVSAKGAYEYFPPSESYQSAKQVIQQMDLVLRNDTRRFSSWYSGSVLYAYQDNAGAYHKKIVLQMRIDGGSWQNIFSGYVKTTQDSYSTGQVSFKVWDAGEILRKRYSTPMLRDYLEHDLVIYYLELAGLTDGIDFISPNYAEGNFVTATIQQSTRRIPYSWLDDEPVWDEIVEVAQATGARIWIDASGLVHYEKGWSWVSMGQATVIEDISEDKYSQFSYGYDDKSFYDEFVVEYAQRTAGDFEETIWQQDRAKIVLPGKTEEVVAKFSNPAATVTTPVAGTHYKLVTLEGADATVLGGVSITFDVYAQQAKITVVNGGTVPIMLWDAHFVGQMITGLPAEQSKRTVAGKGYDRRLEVRSNYYIQTKPQADQVVDFLKWWYETAKPTLSISKLRGDPNRTLGSRITVRARNGSFDGLIIRNSWNIVIANRTVGYTQDIVFISNVFTDDTFFIVGQSQFSQNHKLWF